MTQIPRMVPEGFDLDSYIQQGHVDFLLGETIELELLINDEVAIHLHESRLHPQQKITRLQDNQHRFQAEVQDTGQLRWWLLGFADQIEVVKPDALRAEFTETNRKDGSSLPKRIR